LALAPVPHIEPNRGYRQDRLEKRKLSPARYLGPVNLRIFHVTGPRA
jgi:hypothetical protein